MLRSGALAVVAAGCLTKPAAVPPDAAGDGGPAPCSAGPIVIDNFDMPDAPPCGSGTAIGSMVAIDSNQLELMPAATGTGGPPFTAGCAWAGVPMGGNGVAVQDLTALTTAEGDDVALAIADSAYTLQIHVDVTSTGPMLELSDSNTNGPLASLAYQPGAQWWRLRALDATTYVGEVSAGENGPWSLLGMSSVAATAASVTVSVTATQGTSTQGMADFDNVRACTP